MPDIDFNHILENHKYLPYMVLLIWTFLEGETIVIIAGVAARDGHLCLPLVALCAFCGSLSCDQLLFFVGRYKGKAILAKHPAWQARADKVYRLVERHQTWLILGFRFLYGLRNVTSLTLGMSEVRARRFVILNTIGAVVWAVTFAVGGYLLGEAMETFFTRSGKWYAIGGLAVVAIIVWITRLIRRRSLRKMNKSREQAERKDV